MEFEFRYISLTLEEIDKAPHFFFECDGDNKKIIAKEIA